LSPSDSTNRTNYRIITQGKLGFDLNLSTGQSILELTVGSSKNPKKAKSSYISSSGPCYGYQFPIKNLHSLRHDFTNRNLIYSAKQDNTIVSDDRITIFVSKKEYRGDKLFAILDKFQIRK